MKKLFMTIVMIASLNLATTHKTQAAIGTVFGLVTGNFRVALSALQFEIGLGTYCNTIGDGRCDMGTIGFAYIGLIVLDGEQKVQFSELSSREANELQISKADLNNYNNNIEEINMIFSEVAASLGDNTTREDAEVLWEEASKYLPKGVFKTMQKIGSQK